MKTYTEIKNKIDEYLQRLDKTSDPDKQENICRVLDALLWTIDDNSGAPI